ncbi:MAG: peptidoglycan DD-metalloendopeptidase family protein [Ferrimonas sp.]
MNSRIKAPKQGNFIRSRTRRAHEAPPSIVGRLLNLGVATKKSLICAAAVLVFGYLLVAKNTPETTVSDAIQPPKTIAFAPKTQQALVAPIADEVAFEETLEVAQTPVSPSLLLDSLIEPRQYQRACLISDAGCPTVSHVVKMGDTLSQLFEKYGLNKRYQDKLLQADSDYSVFALSPLFPKNTLNFWFDQNQQLNQFEIEFDPSRQVLYTLNGDEFTVEEKRIDGHWRTHNIVVSIGSGENFSVAAEAKGLSAAQVLEISTLLESKINFNRLQPSDAANILYKYQYIEGVSTKNTRLLAVEFVRPNRNGLQTLGRAYLHRENGNYYDNDGQSLTRAFIRHPIDSKYRISSRFNPRRLHPVTKRVAPHNGTDYAAPTGTPIWAAGDGEVVRVENHPIAGRYVEIKHYGEYRSRYLHMSRVNVRKGQLVERGQTIGTVGATGRVTGPHLHYEFLVGGRAVDSLTVDLPTSTSVDANSRADFLASVTDYQRLMGDESYREAFIAHRHAYALADAEQSGGSTTQ